MTGDAPTPWDDAGLFDVPISAIEHSSYCPRQCALIQEQTFEENVYTVRGRLSHERVDSGDVETRPGVRVLRSLPLWSERLGLRGKADVVELRPSEPPFPVEYKVGRRHPPHADLQLCAQALCLEEMLGVEIPDGAVYSYDVATEDAAGRRHPAPGRPRLRPPTASGCRSPSSNAKIRRRAVPRSPDRAAARRRSTESADSIRIYRLREPLGRHLWTYGVPPRFDQREPLVF